MQKLYVVMITETTEVNGQRKMEVFLPKQRNEVDD